MQAPQLKLSSTFPGDTKEKERDGSRILATIKRGFASLARKASSSQSRRDKPNNGPPIPVALSKNTSSDTVTKSEEVLSVASPSMTSLATSARDEDLEDYLALASRYRDTMARARSRSGGSGSQADASPVIERPRNQRRQNNQNNNVLQPPSEPTASGMERILLPNVTLYRPISSPAEHFANISGRTDQHPTQISPHLGLSRTGLPVHFSPQTEQFIFSPSSPPSPELFRLMEKREITRRFKQLVGYEGDGELEDVSAWAILSSMRRSENKSTKKRGKKRALVDFEWIAREEGRKMWLAGVGDLMTCAVYVR